MPTNDAVTQDGPTCPMSFAEIRTHYNTLHDAADRESFGSYGLPVISADSTWCLPEFRAALLAVVAAERARLRAWFQKHRDRDDEYNYDALACFDAAVAAVDANQRRTG